MEEVVDTKRGCFSRLIRCRPGIRDRPRKKERKFEMRRTIQPNMPPRGEFVVAYSGLRAKKASDRSDLCALFLSATHGTNDPIESRK